MTGSRSSTAGTKEPEPLPDPVTDYALAVMTGEIVAGRLVWLACYRHLHDLMDGAARGYVFDLAKALRAIEFFPTALVHYKGSAFAGEPFELAPWEQFIVGSLFGWVRADTGLRRFNIAYIELARKNGKSALAAGIGLILFVFDNEPGAEVYTAATKRDQAMIVWKDAKKFVEKSPELRRRIQCYRFSLIAPACDAVFLPLAADADTMDGLNPHGVIIDELHAHPTRAVVDVMENAQGARTQALQVEITTAGNSIESVCWDHHEYVVNMLDGLHDDDAWFGYIAALDEGDDWKDEAVWIKANPNLGVSVFVDNLKKTVKTARNQPAKQLDVKQKRFNIWSEGAGGWMRMDRWNDCAKRFTPEQLVGRPCYGGLDLSATTDITAYVEVFPPIASDPLWYVLPYFWVPEAKIAEAKDGELGDRVRYDLWHEQGLVFSTGGDVVDYNAVEDWIFRRDELVDLREVGFDRWNATQIINNLTAAGFVMVEIGQGFKDMSPPTKRLMELVLQGLVAHDGNRVLRWMMGNVSIKIDDADNHKPSKRLSRHRIDGPVALLNALARAIAQMPETESVYATRGILVA